MPLLLPVLKLDTEAQEAVVEGLIHCPQDILLLLQLIVTESFRRQQKMRASSLPDVLEEDAISTKS